MKKNLTTDAKIGLFILIALGIIGYITIDVSNLSITPGGTYTVYTILKNAEGITLKTPVQIAGIPIGVVSDIELQDNRQAKLALKIKKGVVLTEDMEAQVRTRGVLGDTFIELVPGRQQEERLGSGQYIPRSERAADYQNLFDTVSDITEDLKVITAALKSYTETDQSVIPKVLHNMEVLTANLAAVSSANTENMNQIIKNLAILTNDLKNLSSEGGEDLEVALNRIAEITDKINRGEGTLGQLVSEDETADKANQVLDNLEDITNTYFSLQTTVGWHLEYLGRAGTAKNYVDFKLAPRPDRFFLFQVVHNPNPPGSTSFENEVITTNGTVTTVERETTTFDKLRFSAELGMQFSDFTLRGGLIESTGGFGVDYTYGPMVVKMDAYDFGDSNLHLKAMAELNLTKSIYVLGGADDITGKQQRDWFLGAGIRFTDQDINSLFGGAGLLLSR